MTQLAVIKLTFLLPAARGLATEIRYRKQLQEDDFRGEGVGQVQAGVLQAGGAIITIGWANKDTGEQKTTDDDDDDDLEEGITTE